MRGTGLPDGAFSAPFVVAGTLEVGLGLLEWLSNLVGTEEEEEKVLWLSDLGLSMRNNLSWACKFMWLMGGALRELLRVSSEPE